MSGAGLSFECGFDFTVYNLEGALFTARCFTASEQVDVPLLQFNNLTIPIDVAISFLRTAGPACACVALSAR